jgi:hypothetical protein
MKDTKACFEVVAHGDTYAIEIERHTNGVLSVATYQNSFLSTTLPPGVAICFAEWQRNAIPRLCGHADLTRRLILADAAELMLNGRERFR